MSRNYPEGPAVHLRLTEEAMSLRLKPYYPGGLGATVPGRRTAWSDGERELRPSPRWLVETNSSEKNGRRLIWLENEKD